MSISAEANVQLRKWRKLSLRDRVEAARFVRRAARRMGMRPAEWLEAFEAKDAEVSQEAEMTGVELDIDPDRLREILEIILEFIKALLALFGGFAFA